MIPAVAIPSFVALVCKVVLLGYSTRAPAKNATIRLVQLLLVALVSQNSIEFIGFNLFESGVITPALTEIGIAYLVLTIIAVALVLHVSMRLSFDAPRADMRERRQFWVYAPSIILVILLVATDQLVAGFQPYGSTVLRIPGPRYILFESYIVLYLLAALACLVYGARPSRKSPKGRSRNRLLLFSLLPSGLLFLYLIVANHFGMAKITSTIYLPIPMTVFLVVATYATHRSRLPDLAFFVPGSRVRRRKCALYDRVQEMIAEVEHPYADDTLAKRLAETFGCPVEIVGRGASPSRFPPGVLQSVRQIVVADEIEEADPELRALMKLHKVEAIAPFRSHGTGSTCWALFGERFGTEVHTPLDFKYVETLFRRIEECFGENVLPLRSQLDAAVAKLDECNRQLAITWNEIEALRRNLDLVQAENYELSQNVDCNERDAPKLYLPESVASGTRTLQEYLHDREATIVEAALRDSGRDQKKTARLLGIERETLSFLIHFHKLDRNDTLE